MNRPLTYLAVLALCGCLDRLPTEDPPIDAEEPPIDAEPAPQPEAAPPQDPAPPAAPPETLTPAEPAGESGMSWRLNRRFEASEVVDVGCGSEPGRCDPYTGDTDCATALPFLCFEPLDAAAPADLPPGNRYHEWSGGVVRLTDRAWAPTLDGLETFADADALCGKAFGPSWRVARFHDGWGWNFRAYGELPGIDIRAQRFWVLIDDQPNGNCLRR